MKKYNRRYFGWLGFYAVIFLLTLATLLVNAFINFMPNATTKLVLVVVAMVTGILTTISAVILTNRLTMFASLSRSNDYNFGENIAFFDLEAFINRCEKLRKKRSKRKLAQYIIVFTVSNEQIALNLKRNKDVMELNKSISELLLKNINGKKRMKMHSKYVIGFNRGIFYICTFGDDEEAVRRKINGVAKWIYDIQSVKNYRFFIQPMFGVAPFGPEEDISETIDNAIVSRNLSEKNFELLTFYQDSFRKAVDANDAKEIEEALDNNEFVVYYQPKYNLLDRRFTSSEALIRWNSPKYGLLPPSRFIPIAEAAGLIHVLDTFVFKRVLEDISNSIRRGRRVMPVSVNFSLFEFFSPKFLDNILNLLDEYKIDPKLIQIEITETTSQTNQFLSVTIIKKLKEKGIKILMDDFGVGFSNIGNLRKIPFDCIKIDKSFIDTIHTDHKSAEIVKFLIQLCKINGMEVIAEGVDNAKQVDLLKRYHCDEIQGWYYSKALSYADFEKFLMKNPFERKEKEAK